MSYIRRISSRFIDDLVSGELKEFLDVAKHDNDLQLEIRDGYIQIYYLGGQLFKIKPNKTKGYNFTFDIDYCRENINKENKETIANIEIDNIKKWTNIIPILKTEMQEYFARKPKLERQIQQKFCRDNVSHDCEYFVIDMEYQIGRKSRVDMLALHRIGNEIKVALIELKYGHKAIGGNAGLIKHYDDFAYLIENHKKDLTETIKNIYANKVALGLIPKCFELPEIMNFEILFILYNLSENATCHENAIKQIKDRKDRNENIDFTWIKIPKKNEQEKHTIRGESAN